jgi:hypothetical protein
MIVSAQTLRLAKPISPFHERTVVRGMSFGLSCAGYDVRIAEDLVVTQECFQLASTVEKFDMPTQARVAVLDGRLRDGRLKLTSLKCGAKLGQAKSTIAWHLHFRATRRSIKQYQ